jgi:hypothetical protein
LRLMITGAALPCPAIPTPHFHTRDQKCQNAVKVGLTCDFLGKNRDLATIHCGDRDLLWLGAGHVS